MIKIPKTETEYLAWRLTHALTGDVHAQAEKVRLSFKSLAMNKNNPAALESLQRLHDADMAKLEAMFN